MNPRFRLPQTFWMTLAVLALAVQSADVALDATSGASGGRKMVTISKVNVTTNTASITFSEGYSNGTLRLYYSTTAFASTSDTTRSTVTKMNVTTRGSGTVRITGLTASTKYYYKFQGYYPRGVANYWATGSFTMEAISGLRSTAGHRLETGYGFEAVDALGRRSSGSPVTHTPDGSSLQPRTERR